MCEQLEEKSSYYEKHKEERKNYQRNYFKEHREKIREYNREYQRQNPKKDYLKTYYETHKEQFRNYERKHRDERIKNKKIRILKLKSKIFHLLGDKCVKCGFSDIRILQIDHINGNGNKEIKQFRGYREGYYGFVLKSIENKEEKYQLLCPNCNWLKRIENNEI
jgi:hypothetical protein